MKKLLLFQSVLMLSGIVFGMIAYLVLSDEQVLTLHQYLTAQMQNLTSISQLEAGSRILKSNGLELLRVYLTGICLLGLPILILLLFLKGFSFGFVSCFLISRSPLLILTRFLYLPVFLLAVAMGIRFSWIMVQNRMNSPARQLVEYTFLFGLLLILTIICSYADGLSCSAYLNGLVG